MDFSNGITNILIVIGIVSLMYKIYQQSRLDDKKRKASVTILFLHYYSTRYVLPISQRGYKDSDLRIIRNANRALAIFWIAFILVIIVAAIRQFLMGYSTST